MNEAQYRNAMDQVREKILKLTAPEHRSRVMDELDNVVPKDLWNGILMNAENLSLAEDPHWITGFTMHKESVSIQYHRPLHPTDQWRSVSYLFN